MYILGDALRSVFRTVSFSDLLDIALVTVLVYQLMKLVRDTRVAQILKGLIFLVVVYLVARQVGLRTIRFILEKLFDIGIVALVVVFQPELRRMLEHVGQTQVSQIKVFGKSKDYVDTRNKVWQKAINNICEAVSDMSELRTGALIVLERNIKLQDIIRTGTIIDAVPSSHLIQNIFFKNSPLHDGGMVIRDGKLIAAGCLFPLSQNSKIAKELGTRHRAALGISEISDSIVIVVSEETGVISIAKEGYLTRRLSISGLKTRLEKEILISLENNKTPFGSYKKRVGKKDE